MRADLQLVLVQFAAQWRADALADELDPQVWGPGIQ